MSTEQEIAPVESEEVVEPGNTPEPSAAAPAAAADTPSGGEEAQPSETKTYTKDELERIVAKERARERRKLERQMQQPAQAPQAPATVDGEPAKPSISQFQTVEEYDAAMSAWADKRADYRESVKEKQQAELRQKQAQHEILAAHEDREDSARDKYADYDAVVGNPNLPITSVMADAIRVSDVGPDVAYFLGQPANIQEAARISKLPPLLQVKEIGKLEAKLATAAPAKDVSSVPPPIRTLRGSAQNLTPTPSDNDSIDVWLKKRNAQIMAKRQAGHRR
jgi:hypothetical protein